MIEELIQAAATALAGGNAATVILLCIGLALTGAVWRLWTAKESQAERHTDAMNAASERHAATLNASTETLTTLVEQLRTVSERQRELLSVVATAGQNAAKNNVSLAKIETMLSVVSKKL